MALITVAGTIFVYLLVIFILYKIFEKFFKVMFFIISAAFAIALIYLIYKGF